MHKVIETYLQSVQQHFTSPLKLQVSVLTDQVEAQGEKIRDLEICLEGHQLKLNATEEMLQQVKIWIADLLQRWGEHTWSACLHV